MRLLRNQKWFFYMNVDERTAKKNYPYVKSSRLVAKAEENIRAVEQQRFPVGIPEMLVKGSRKAKSKSKGKGKG
jgi:hypothetical protein